tara:strand:+ start:60 stop:848 length:789 start_codon:yes stop_codon:yes gene_type:complete
MIDFHNHIIPNLDDGSKSVEMTLNMLKVAQSQGITDVVNTVHFQHPKMENKNTSYEYVIEKRNEIQNIADKNNIDIKIHLASEVFFKFNLTEILNNPLTTFGKGKFMLIEFQRLSFPEGYENEIFKIQLKGITPVIAHPERYRGVQNNLKLIEKWINQGYLIQIDGASILGGFGKETQKTAIDLIKNGYCHLIGSDAHNDKNRNFLLAKAYSEFKNIVGSASLDIIIENSKRVMNGDSCLSYHKLISKKSILDKIMSFIKNN